MPPIVILFRVVIFFAIIAAGVYGAVWIFRYFWGADTRNTIEKMENKVDVDEFKADVKIDKMKSETQQMKNETLAPKNKAK